MIEVILKHDIDTHFKLENFLFETVNYLIPIPDIQLNVYNMLII